MACVYRHIRLDKNMPFYIGISKNNKRPYTKRGRNSYWNNIVKLTDYEVEILFENVDENFAKEKEIEFIKLYGRKDIGTGILCNLTDGGDSDFKGGSLFLSKEHKKKIGIAVSGKKSYMFGVKKTDEIKEKISISTSKKVIDTKTMKIYKSVREAAVDTDYSFRHLGRFLRNECTNKTNMMYLDNYKILNKTLCL